MIWWTLQQLKSKNAKTRLAVIERLTPPMAAEVLELLHAALADEDPQIRRGAALALGRSKSENILEPLLKRFNDSEPEVRCAVIDALKITADPAAIPAIINALQDPSPDVSWRASQALKEMGWQPQDDAQRAANFIALGDLDMAAGLGPPAIEALANAARHGIYHKRVRAVELLGRIDDPRTMKPLLDCLKNTDWSVRAAAAVALGQVGDVRAVEPLVGALMDSERQVRVAVIGALSQLGDARAVEPLVRVLKDPAPGVRVVVVEALGKLHDRRAAAPIAALLSDPDPDVRQNAANAVGVLGDPETVEPLVIALKDESSAVRQSAARALRIIDPYWERSDAAQRALPALQAALKDKEYWVRYAAADVLAKLGQVPMGEPKLVTATDGARQKRSAALGVLASLLEDPERSFRLAAIEALGRLNEPQATVTLVPRLADRDPWIRGAAAGSLKSLRWQPASVVEQCRQLAALGQWGEIRSAGADAVEPVLELLSWPGPETRRGAVEVLAQLGDARSIPGLRAARSDVVPAVRSAAATALAMIGAEPGPGVGPEPETQSEPEAQTLPEIQREAAGSEAWLDILGDLEQPEEVRMAAEHALVASATPDLMPLLVARAQDPLVADRVMRIMLQLLSTDGASFATQDLETIASWVGLPVADGGEAPSMEAMAAFDALSQAANEELSRRAEAR